MDVKDYLKLESRLKVELGNHKFENIVDGVSKIVRENNLDTTPTILDEIFDYVKQTIHLSKI